MYRVLIVLILAITSFHARANASIMEFWHSARFESDNVVLEISVDSKSGSLKQLSIQLDGSTALVPERYLANVPAVVVTSVRLEWGCGTVARRYPELEDGSHYCQSVSVEFDDGPDERPDWYESPRAIFTFSGGRFIERRIWRKKGADRWSEGVE